MKQFLLLPMFLVASLGGQAQCLLKNLDDPSSGYKKVFSDEFDYASNDRSLLIDQATSKWHSGFIWQTNGGNRVNYVENNNNTTTSGYIDYSWGNYGFSSIDTSTNRPYCEDVNATHAYTNNDISLVDNNMMSDGKALKLDYTFHNNPIVINDTVKFHKTSGLLESNREFKYGIFEIRCKVPSTDGLRAAFWLWGNGGELDVFETEYLAYQNRRSFFSTIQPCAPNKSGLVTNYEWKTDPSYAYHTYTLAWTPTKMTWFIDGYEIRTDNLDADRLAPTGCDNMNKSMRLVLSAHYLYACQRYDASGNPIGGRNNFCDMPTASGSGATGCSSPQDPFLIDYIRVYEPNNGVAGTWPEYKTTEGWTDSRLTNSLSAQTPFNPTSVTSAAVGTGINTRLYYLSGSTLCYAYPGSTNLTQPWQFTTTVAANVKPGSHISIDNTSGNVFYVGNNNSIWVYAYLNGAWINQDLNNGSYSYNADKLEVAYDSNRRRLYYASSDRKMYYYQFYDNSNPSWQLVATSVNNIDAVNPSIAVRGDYVYYNDFNGELYTYSAAGSWFTSMNWNGTPDNIYGNITVDKQSNSSRIYFMSNGSGSGSAKRLSYYEWVPTGSPNWQRFDVPSVNNLSPGSKILPNGQVFTANLNGTVDTYHNWNNQWGNHPVNVLVNTKATNLLGESNDVVYFFNQDQELHMFKWGSCETLNPPVSTSSGGGITPILMRPALATNARVAEEPSMEVYPNPNQGKLTVETKQAGIYIQHITLFNSLGQICLEQVAKSSKCAVDATQLQPGVYRCRLLLSNGKTASRSIVIQR